MHDRKPKIIIAFLIVVVSFCISSIAQVTTLEEALDCPDVVWLYGGDEPWFSIRSPSHDGVDAARSGIIGDGESSSIGSYFIGPGKLSFWWKVSSEMNADILWLFVNGEMIDAITGNRDWTYREIRLPAGVNIVVWEYSKDETISEGLDAGFLDEVNFTSDNIQSSQPKLEITRSGSGIVLSWQLRAIPFVLEESDDLFNGWRKSSLTIVTNQGIALAIATNITSKKFFRLKSE